MSDLKHFLLFLLFAIIAAAIAMACCCVADGQQSSWWNDPRALRLAEGYVPPARYSASLWHLNLCCAQPTRPLVVSVGLAPEQEDALNAQARREGTWYVGVPLGFRACTGHACMIFSERGVWRWEAIDGRYAPVARRVPPPAVMPRRRRPLIRSRPLMAQPCRL